MTFNNSSSLAPFCCFTHLINATAIKVVRRAAASSKSQVKSERDAEPNVCSAQEADESLTTSAAVSSDGVPPLEKPVQGQIREVVKRLFPSKESKPSPSKGSKKVLRPNAGIHFLIVVIPVHKDVQTAFKLVSSTFLIGIDIYKTHAFIMVVPDGGIELSAHPKRYTHGFNASVLFEFYKGLIPLMRALTTCKVSLGSCCSIISSLYASEAHQTSFCAGVVLLQTFLVPFKGRSAKPLDEVAFNVEYRAIFRNNSISKGLQKAFFLNYNNVKFIAVIKYLVETLPALKRSSVKESSISLSSANRAQLEAALEAIPPGEA